MSRGGTGRGRSGAVALLLTTILAGNACDQLGAGLGEQQAAPEASPVATTVETGPLATFIDEIPPADVPPLDLQAALTLVAMPLSCLDRPHAAPRDRSTYLDDFVASRRPDYERNRAFYGCWDWHSAVNSTWAMVRIYKEFPELPIGGLVEEKLRDHLSGQAMQGELEFFNENRGFEQPYGYAWLLMLYAELRTWDHPDASRWANNVEPLANLFSERMVQTLPRQDRPSRSGAHSNTAFALAMMLDAARTLDDVPLQDAIMEAAPRLYGDDFGCPTGYEPWGADFLSPCLEEAALMAAVYDTDRFVAWFDRFMPAVTSAEFLPLTTPVYTRPAADAAAVAGAEAAGSGTGGGAAAEAATARDQTPPDTTGAAGEGDPGAEPGASESTDASGDEGGESDALRELASRSHLIGLAFIRADAMNRIAAALPAGDARAEAYRKLAALHGSLGFAAMFDADYAGSHWIGTFALKYLLTHPGN